VCSSGVPPRQVCACTTDANAEAVAVGLRERLADDFGRDFATRMVRGDYWAMVCTPVGGGKCVWKSWSVWVRGWRELCRCVYISN